MLARLEQTTTFLGRAAGMLVLIAASTLPAAAQRGSPANQRDSIEETHRAEGEAILAIADAAMAGKALPSDFVVQWQNDFVKAQRGTFVPFTLTLDASRLSKRSALVYVRARRRQSQDDTYAVDAIFPVELRSEEGQLSRVSRGFAVSPGDYDVFVVMRERVEPAAGKSRARPKAAVLRQQLSVPEFSSGELTTSSVIVADRLTTLAEPLPADQLAERPYAIGRNEITPAADRRFRRDEELVVVLLVYNPTVTAERQFDVKVEYHFFRKTGANPSDVLKGSGAEALDAAGRPPGPHPPVLAGEQYFNHTEPQRFNSALMGAAFDPAGGDPVMAGQVVPLAGFQEGEYRLGVQVVDLLSGKSISRDVFFTVGS
jgi:hypothetical protein